MINDMGEGMLRMACSACSGSYGAEKVFRVCPLDLLGAWGAAGYWQWQCSELQNPSNEFYETCHSVTSYFLKKDSKRCFDTTMPESIHTKDESKRGSAFAFIFGVN